LFPLSRLLSLMGYLDSAFAPPVELLAELVVGRVVDLELFPAEPSETAEHLGKQGWCETAILLGRELEEPVEPVAPLDRHQVDEVSRLGSPEHGEHLVDRQLSSAEQGSRPPRFGREEPRVRSQVDLSAIVSAFDDQAGEAGVHLDVVDNETRLAERSLNGREKPIDSSLCQAEEVEVASVALDVAADDQRRSAASAKPSASSRPAMISATCSCSGLSNYPAPRCWRTQSAHALRTAGGSTSSSQSSSSRLASTKKRTSSSVPSRSTCSWTRARSPRSSRS